MMLMMSARSVAQQPWHMLRRMKAVIRCMSPAVEKPHQALNAQQEFANDHCSENFMKSQWGHAMEMQDSECMKGL